MKKRGVRKNLTRGELRRARAIAFWERGLTHREISEKLGVHRVTVSVWIKRFRQGGYSALKTRPGQGARKRFNWSGDASRLVSEILQADRHRKTLVSLKLLHELMERKLPHSSVTLWSAMRGLWETGEFVWEIELVARLSNARLRRFRARRVRLPDERTYLVIVRSQTNRYYFCGDLKRREAKLTLEGALARKSRATSDQLAKRV